MSYEQRVHLTFRRAALVVLAILSAAGCAAGRAAPGGGSPPAGYADIEASVPLFVRSAAAFAPVGRDAAEARRLPGRGRAVMRGLDVETGELPVRESVWWGDAVPVSADADSVIFATAWIPVGRLAGDLRCSGSSTTRAGARLAAVLRDSNGDLEVEAWLETSGLPGCEGDAGVRQRVRAFADDVEMFARRVARMGIPLPAR